VFLLRNVSKRFRSYGTATSDGTHTSCSVIVSRRCSTGSGLPSGLGKPIRRTTRWLELSTVNCGQDGDRSGRWAYCHTPLQRHTSAHLAETKTSHLPLEQIN